MSLGGNRFEAMGGVASFAAAIHSGFRSVFGGRSVTLRSVRVFGMTCVFVCIHSSLA